MQFKGHRANILDSFFPKESSSPIQVLDGFTYVVKNLLPIPSLLIQRRLGTQGQPSIQAVC